MANDGEYRMQATEHDITFLFSVGLCLRFGLRPKPRCELVRKSNMNQCSSSHLIARASMTMQEQNYRIVLPPARGPSFRGLEHSQIAFFSNHFRELSSCCSGTLVFQIFKQNAGPNGTPKLLENDVKNRIEN